MPVYPGVVEMYQENPNPVPGLPVPDVNINVRIAAMACGLGDIGWSKVFLHPVFGPRVRIGNILTDAELEADPSLGGLAAGEVERAVARGAQHMFGDGLVHGWVSWSDQPAAAGVSAGAAMKPPDCSFHSAA